MNEKQTKAAELMERLENLRAEQPILWAIVRGYTSRIKIGLLTGMTPKQVDAELEELRKAHEITHLYGRAWVISKKGKNYEALSEAAKLARLIEARWTAWAIEEELSEIGEMLSSAGANELTKGLAQKKFVGEGENQVRVLTDKQQKAWDQIKGWLEDQGRNGEPFTTREAAKAQGFDKPGFTKNIMLAMVKKKRAEHIEGRPEKWRLIE